MISDHDIEDALVEILGQPNAPIPTPGVVYRHLKKRMNCCGCAPLAVETIYAKMDELVAKGLICPCACATAQDKLGRIKSPAPRRPMQKAQNVDRQAPPSGSSLLPEDAET